VKILSCNINGFGGLCDLSFDFDSNLSCIIEKNGFGKTTLAAFIKAMFFGMPTARKNASLDSSDRAKYNPWSASCFGGQLVFSLGDKKYRIVRKFDAKTPTRDEFMLLDADTGLASNDFSENIGEEIFGLNEEAFVKSTFSNGNVNLDGLPENIRAKISSSVNVADDLDSFSVAEKNLKEAYKRVKKDIDECKQKIQNAKTLSERYKRENDEYSRINSQIAELTQGLNLAEKQEEEIIKAYNACAKSDADLIKKKNYDEANEKSAILKERIDLVMQKYTKEMPDYSFCDELHRAVGDNDEISIMLTAQRQSLQRFGEQTVFEKFEENYTDKDTIQNLQSLEMSTKQSSEGEKSTVKAPPKFIIPLLSVFVLLGVALCFVNVIIAAVIISVFGVLLATMIALTIAAQKSSALLLGERDKAKNELDSFIEKYYGKDSTASLNKLVVDLDLYDNHYRPTKNKLCELENALKENLKDIAVLLEKIGYSGQNKDNLSALDNEIRRDLDRLIQLKNELKECLLRRDENFDKEAFERLKDQNCDSSTAEIEQKLSLVRSRINELKNSIVDKKNAIFTVSLAGENLNEQQQIIEDETENLLQNQNNSAVILKTLELLENAKNELFKKYAQSIIDAFDKYSGVFFASQQNDFNIGTELDITVKQDGVAHKASAFSEGQQSIIDVCLRLSLVDAMFENERPFLILDDPFYALDDENFKKAAELIRKVSENTQVIYLTCNLSRRI